MSGIEFTVDTSELGQIFDKIESLVAMTHGKKGYPKNPVRIAARKMAKVVEERARVLAPVSDDEQSGRLRDAIGIKLLSARFRDNATRLGNSREYYFLGVKLGSSRADPRGAWYATPVEVGWKQGEARFEGHHFLMDAIKTSKDQAMKVFVDDLGRQVIQITRKLERQGLMS